MKNHLRIASLAGLLLIGLVVTPFAYDGLEPLVVACGTSGQPADFFPEVRLAAGLAANLDLNRQIKDDFPTFLGDTVGEVDPKTLANNLSLDELKSLDPKLSTRIEDIERIAQGASRQCREVAEPSSYDNYMLSEVLSSNLGIELSSPLSQIYLAQSLVHATIHSRESNDFSQQSFNKFLSQALLDQAHGFVGSLLTAPSYELTLSRSALYFYPLFLALGDSNSENGTLDVLNPARWVAIACGSRVIFSSLGVEFDGSIFVQNNDSSGYPVRQTAAEFWSLSSILLNVLYLIFDPNFADRYMENALHGCSSELRMAASNLYIAINPSLTADELESLAKVGGSPELQIAAASHLVSFWSQDATRSDADLQQVAISGETHALKAAASYALGLRWLKRVESGELDFATRFTYPPNGGIAATDGTLGQFAAVHAGVHPELAEASVIPLFQIFRSNAK